MDPLTRRLVDELSHEVSADVRADHLAAMNMAINLDAVSASGASASSLARMAATTTWRRRLAVVGAAATLAAVPTVAAAQDAMPGDLLYPLKTLVEPVQALFVDDIVAEHRADEVAQLLDDSESPNNAPQEALENALENALVRAEEALESSNASQTARDRVEMARDAFEARFGDDTESDEPGQSGDDHGQSDAEDHGQSDAEDHGQSGDAPGRSGDAPGQSGEDHGNPNDTDEAADTDDTTDTDDGGRLTDVATPTIDLPAPAQSHRPSNDG